MTWWLTIFWDIVKICLDRIGYFNPPENRPEVILDRIEHEAHKEGDYFIAKNIGNKTALNIELSSINLNTKMPFNLSKDILKLIFEFSEINNLDPKQEKRFDCDVYIIEKDGRKVKSDSAKSLYFSCMFNPKYAHTDSHLLFEYCDSSGRKYVTHFSIGKSGILTKVVYLIKRPELINKLFRKYGITYIDGDKQEQHGPGPDQKHKTL